MLHPTITPTPNLVRFEHRGGKLPGVEYRNYLFPVYEQAAEGEPVWINEMGYATSPGCTEEEQANWWERAVGAFLATQEIEHIG